MDASVPKGNSYYCKAKREQHINKDLNKAEKFYKLAIRHRDKLESAVKDLATVLHQQGRTAEACKILEENKAFCRKGKDKIENLLVTLKK